MDTKGINGIVAFDGRVVTITREPQAGRGFARRQQVGAPGGVSTEVQTTRYPLDEVAGAAIREREWFLLRTVEGVQAVRFKRPAHDLFFVLAD